MNQMDNLEIIARIRLAVRSADKLGFHNTASALSDCLEFELQLRRKMQCAEVTEAESTSIAKIQTDVNG